MKLIILDRDGVINHHSEHFIKTPEEWRPLAGAPEAIAQLTQWGWRIVVATNQSGIGRGLFRKAAAEEQAAKEAEALAAANSTEGLLKEIRDILKEKK